MYHTPTAYDTSTAAADGSVTQWEEGYFIAHEWSENGQMILSKPAYVVVDEQHISLYHQ